MAQILEVLFLFCLVLVGWGPLSIPAGPGASFVIGGSTWESFIPLFVFYLFSRVFSKDLKAGKSWKDPFLLFGILAFFSAFWNPFFSAPCCQKILTTSRHASGPVSWSLSP